MNNEPVAWMDKNGVPSAVKNELYNIPLCIYPAKTIWCACGDGITADSGALCGNCASTHPAKTLTDEEIDTIVRDFFGEVNSFYDFRLVIRRCIRKAQET